MLRIALIGLALVFGATSGNARDAAAAATDCNQTEDADKSLAACTELIEVHKVDGLNLAVAYFKRGLAYDSKQNYVAAIAEYDHAIKVKPDLQPLYFKRGLAHRRNGQPDLSVADYTKAIELDPKDADSVSNRGRAYLDLGEKDKAIADFRAALVLDPKHDKALAHLEELGLKP